ncbi:ribonuclease J [Candidatus Woesebacteria bacterium]|nr:ribonuclease J [Candidatus Woesebacteria bacterium]
MLRFIAISGTTDVTENFYVYENDTDMIVVDCGVGFPEPDMFGVDLVIPDFTYVKQNAKKLRAILISHGHEDHIGALPFLFKEINAPIYSTKLVAGFIEDKFSDYGKMPDHVNIFNPERDVLSLGSFRVTPFRISHSVPDAVGFCIETSEGKIFHIPDFKFDWTPVDGRPFDVAKAALLSSNGALALVCDCLGATNPGYTQSEIEIENRIETIINGKKGQVFFTTISSNISRMQQALNVAIRNNRKVAFIGRSIDRKAEIARRLGYLHYPGDLVVPSKKLDKLSPEKVMYIISGSYGQPGSALDRVSLGEHEYLSIQEGDVVIFSSDPAPPGSRENVDAVVDRLIATGADVHYYDLQEDLHVSGHGSSEDIKMLFGLIKPKYFIPVGGTVRHMRAYQKLVEGTGRDPNKVFELLPGESVEFSGGNARPGRRLSVKSVLVDGLGVGDVGNIVLRDRQALAEDGMVIAMLKFDRVTKNIASDPELISRGFVFEEKQKNLLDAASSSLNQELSRRKTMDEKIIKNIAIDFLERYFYKQTARRPMILPVIVEV